MKVERNGLEPSLAGKRTAFDEVFARRNVGSCQTGEDEAAGGVTERLSKQRV